MTEELDRLLKRLAEEPPKLLTGTRDGRLEILEEPELIRVCAMSGRVSALTEKGEYLLRQRLYELEERRDPCRFVRISNSEIINLKKVRHFDLRLTGTICVRLSDGTVTYVSRRYVGKIKKLLGI